MEKLSIREFSSFLVAIENFFNTQYRGHLSVEILSALCDKDFADFLLDSFEVAYLSETLVDFEGFFDSVFDKIATLRQQTRMANSLYEKSVHYAQEHCLWVLVDNQIDGGNISKKVEQKLIEKFGDNFLTELAKIDKQYLSAEGKMIFNDKIDMIANKYTSQLIQQYVYLKNLQETTHQYWEDDGDNTRALCKMLLNARFNENEFEYYAFRNEFFRAIADVILSTNKQDTDFCFCAMKLGFYEELKSKIAPSTFKVLCARAKVDDFLQQNQQAEVQNISQGVPVSAGKASGIAEHLCCLDDYKKNHENKIIITEQVFCENMQYLYNVKGILTIRGGILSHTAILARELGIPCVTGLTKYFCDSIKNGDIVNMNGETGKVSFEPASEQDAEHAKQ